MTPEQLQVYLVKRHPVFLRFVTALVHDPHIAEDIVQAKYLQLLEKLVSDPTRLEKVRPGACDNYFFAALRNAIRDFMKRPSGTLSALDSPETVMGAEPEPPDVARFADAIGLGRAVLREAFATLSVKERQAFCRYWQTGWDRQDALASLGLSEASDQEKYSSYDAPLHRARTKLHGQLRPHVDLLKSMEYHHLREAINDLCCGDLPGAAT
jgi:DNA-directed RNA polymerase specialized sigma24 family protein